MRSLCSTASRCTLATCVNSCGEPRQFEVVRGEQRRAPVLLEQVARDGPGQRQAVEGGGAAADLVHQHQARRRGVVQDVGGLGHLDHEGRAPAGEVVGGADAREDLVDRRRCARVRAGTKRAAVREQRDQRDLAHVGRFAAHVGAGDQQHAGAPATSRVSLAMKCVDLRFDHRMAAAFDLDHRLVARTRARHSRASARARRRSASRSSSASARGDALQRGDVRRERVEQLLVEQLLARQRALLRGQRLVLEGLQFRRDVALGVLQRLAAAVVVRHLFRLRARDLDVEAVHAVVLDLEVGDAGARALARFELEQELAAVGLRSRAVRRVRRRSRRRSRRLRAPPPRARPDRAREQRRAAAASGAQRRRASSCEARACRGLRAAHAIARQARQRVAQPGQVARPRALQRDARGDALDVGAAACSASRSAAQALRRPRRAAPTASSRARTRRAVAQRVVQRSGAAGGCPCRWRRCRAATAASAPASPRSVSVISRLRRVAASMRT